MMPGTGRSPVALDPFMPAADPIPISADPYISRRRGYPDNLHTGRRRRHHDHSVGVIVALIGNDHAPRQGHRQDQTGGAQPLALIHDDNRLL